MSKRLRHNKTRKRGPHPRKVELAQTQKRREWEFFVLRDRRDAVMNLLRLAEMSENHDAAARLREELETIELRGAKILEEQTQFLSR